MNFKELKKGFPVYILNKQTLEYSQGKVIQDATPPRINPTFGQSLLTDVSIECAGSSKIWTLPADQKVAEMQNDSEVIIALDKDTIVTMIKSINQECQSYLDGVETYKKKLELSKKLIAELDITYRQQQQTEERFAKLENAIESINDKLETTLNKILNAVNK